MPDDHAELDRWIAEYVMKWHPNNFHKCTKHMLGTMCWCDNELNDLVEYDDWHPTTDIKQAIEVAEQFEKWSVSSWREIYRCHLYHNDELGRLWLNKTCRG
jgi:hypothetical protein